ncbi:MESH1 pyrophosphohydrolase, partial [Upupa epops]|nr:MESH1 pyrophosphohydrolase [Upupa epops]
MGSEAAALLEAADFAARKHKGQRRKDPEGTPFINHPIGAEPPVPLFRGLTPDAPHPRRSSRPHFLCSGAVPKAERKRLQIERAPGSSPRAKLVKLADKLYNLRDLNRCTPQG